ncbi:hypothetical protein [Shimia aestuarii]|uniref:hypothetical protein n=1 Tax=Shimia aestuarii TaxID=254406 RepID=UPI001FB2C981|nr:hypothetical protein [Shimia aestuarii]
MTDQTPSYKALRKHVYNVQEKTCLLSGLIQVIADLEGRTQSGEAGKDALIYIAEGMIKEIDRDLDFVDLPELTG